jgi:hypothetical protein
MNYVNLFGSQKNPLIHLPFASITPLRLSDKTNKIENPYLKTFFSPLAKVTDLTTNIFASFFYNVAIFAFNNTYARYKNLSIEKWNQQESKKWNKTALKTWAIVGASLAIVCGLYSFGCFKKTNIVSPKTPIPEKTTSWWETPAIISCSLALGISAIYLLKNCCFNNEDESVPMTKLSSLMPLSSVVFENNKNIDSSVIKKIIAEAETKLKDLSAKSDYIDLFYYNETPFLFLYGLSLRYKENIAKVITDKIKKNIDLTTEDVEKFHKMVAIDYAIACFTLEELKAFAKEKLGSDASPEKILEECASLILEQHKLPAYYHYFSYIALDFEAIRTIQTPINKEAPINEDQFDMLLGPKKDCVKLYNSYCDLLKNTGLLDHLRNNKIKEEHRYQSPRFDKLNCATYEAYLQLLKEQKNFPNWPT